MCGLNGFDRVALENEPEIMDEGGFLAGLMEVLNNALLAKERTNPADMSIDDMVNEGREAFEHAFSTLRKLNNSVGIYLVASADVEKGNELARNAVKAIHNIMKLEHARANVFLNRASELAAELETRGYTGEQK